MASPTNFLFGEPIRCELQSLDKGYYLQRLSVDTYGVNVLITSDWFRSDGIRGGVNNKPEMLFNTSGVVRTYLNAIENAAVQQLKIPLDLVREHGIPTECPAASLYRPLNQSEYIYAKLERECPIFNAKRRNNQNRRHWLWRLSHFAPCERHVYRNSWHGG